MHPDHVFPTNPPVSSPKSKLFDGLSREQKTIGIIGLISIILLTMCCCVGWLAALLGADEKKDDNKKSSSKSGQQLTPDPSPTTNEMGKLYGEGHVTGVSTADLIEISLGEQKQKVKIIGITAPSASGEAPQCWANESKRFSDQTLMNQTVRLFSTTEPAGINTQDPVQAHIILSDNTNFAMHALEAGTVITSDMESGELANKFHTAERLADESNKGIWGEPCNGSLDLPQVTQSPAPAAPSESVQPFTQQPVPAAPPATKPDTYYSNCSEARDAGAAPMYRGEPGYSTNLDRDNDGVACDS